MMALAAPAGLVQATWHLLKWGVQFADMDNDGWLDIVQANGHVYPEVDDHKLGLSYRQPLSLFRNRNGTFKDVGAVSGPAFETLETSRGLATGDLNNDGALDIVVQNLDAKPWVIMSPGPSGNWLLLDLKGAGSNRRGVGARITLRVGSSTQIREVKSGGSYQSHCDLRVHFGVGTERIVDELRIRWPSGVIQTMTKVTVNQILKIEEPSKR